MTTRKIGRDYEIYDELWKKIEPLIPQPKPKKKAGRPRKDDRKMMTAIFYILRTGCQWKTLPRSLGAPSTVHDRFQGSKHILVHIMGVFGKRTQKVK